MYTNIYHPELNPAAYPESLVAQPNWNRFDLAWNRVTDKFAKTPVDIGTGKTANKDGIGHPHLEVLRTITDNQVLAYRHPALSPKRLALLDCDNCVEWDGTVSPFVQDLLRAFDCYSEYSVSGTGVHTLCWISADTILADDHKHQASGIEFYWSKNTIPITGKRVSLPDWTSPTDIQELSDFYAEVHRELFPVRNILSTVDPLNENTQLSPEEVLYLLFNEKNGDYWRSVYNGDWSRYPSPSEADFALLKKLAFYTQCNREMMIELFSSSPLAHILVRSSGRKLKVPKWKIPKYRDRTVDEVLRRTTVMYQSSQKGGAA